MKILFNSKSPTRIEVLLNPADELEVSPELGARLQAANPQLVEAPKKKLAEKLAGKGKGKGKG